MQPRLPRGQKGRHTPKSPFQLRGESVSQIDRHDGIEDAPESKQPLVMENVLLLLEKEQGRCNRRGPVLQFAQGRAAAANRSYQNQPIDKRTKPPGRIFYVFVYMSLMAPAESTYDTREIASLRQARRFDS